MKKLYLIIPLFMMILLSSCSIIINKDDSKEEIEPETESIFSTEDSNPDAYDHYTLADVDYSVYSLKNIYNSAKDDVLPSTGKINILVLPIEIKDYEFDSDYKTTLDKALNGDGINDTNYWESLSSYYYKSSYGQLELHCEIADKYELNLTTSEIYSQYKNSYIGYSGLVINQAYNNYKNVYGIDKAKEFDSDLDGTIDAVIGIYSANHVGNDTTLASLDPKADFFWAYQYSLNNYHNRNTENPIVCNYLWLSQYFFYRYGEKTILDCHTIIHETGHLLGLDDYYSYTEENRLPAGGAVMMDLNIGDHDPFSKLALGWIKPTFVYGKAKLELEDFESTGQCILISDNWNGTAFDEYLLLELYSPTNLNELDSTEGYSNYRKSDPRYAKSHYEKLYSSIGVRIWHVDSRIGRYYRSYNPSYVINVPNSLDDKYSYMVMATNSFDDYLEKGFYDCLRLVENNTNYINNNVPHTSNLSLWYDDTFTISNHNNQFTNYATFNNHNQFNYSINIKVIDNKAEITIDTI